MSEYVASCKVCNSHFREIIENLHIEGLSPAKIMQRLRSNRDATERQILEEEDITESAIRRHLARHFNVKDSKLMAKAETKARIEKSRDTYKRGQSIHINKVNAVSHLIDFALNKIEEVENEPRSHSTIIQYINSIKGLIETLNKLTGDLKTENRVDEKFFINEVTRFTELIMNVVTELDKQLNLNGELQFYFAAEFKKQYEAYQIRQQRILEGELPVSYGSNDNIINTFNEE